MEFNSITFILSFPIIALILFVLPKRWQWIWLLGVSLVVYGAIIPHYLLLLLFIIAVTYYAALHIHNERNKNGRRALWYCWFSVTVIIGLLIAFKYLNFFSQSAHSIARFLNLNYSHNLITVAIPIGLSFYSLQAIGYVLSVYKGTVEPERHLGRYALYISFFPQILAGPLSLPGHLLPQLSSDLRFNYRRVADGLLLMTWGFFKKLVIADRAAIMVNEVYDRPQEYWGVFLIIATVLFTVQVYADFSGYSDIAIGAAGILGIDLKKNFSRPLLAQSTADLWRRWHMTLVTWWRTFVYIPLGGSRAGAIRWHISIAAVFLLSGLWHGPDWKFICWAMLNIAYVFISRWTQGMRAFVRAACKIDRFPVFHHSMQILITMLLFSTANIFFRAHSISDALYILKNSFRGLDVLLQRMLSADYENIKAILINQQKITIFGFTKPAFLAEAMILICAVAVLMAVYIYQESNVGKRIVPVFDRPWYVRWLIYYGLLFSIVFLGMIPGHRFIYGF